MIIDTHIHLYSQEFASDIDAVMERALTQNVSKFYMPAIDSSTHEAMLQVETVYPATCFAMMGLHPCSVKENYRDELALIKNYLEERKFSAIGETGLDFYWDKTFAKEQYEALEIQAEWALQYNLPLVLHTRNAMQETIDVVKSYSSRGLRGIFHCFGGSLHEADQIIESGFYMGIGGVITYKKSGLAEVLASVDIKHLVLETDAPYLTPVPHRGKRNESSYLPHIITKLAEVKGITADEVITATTTNAHQIFG